MISGSGVHGAGTGLGCRWNSTSDLGMRLSSAASRQDSSCASSTSMRSPTRNLNPFSSAGSFTQGMMTNALGADRDVPTFIGTAQIYLTASPLRHALSLSNLALADSAERKHEDYMRPSREKAVDDMYTPCPQYNHAPGSPVRDVTSSLHTRPSPLRASHDFTFTSLHGDTDSGISTRLRPSFSSLSPRQTATDALHSSRAFDFTTPRSSRSLLRSSGSRGSHDSLRSPSPMRSQTSPSSNERKVSDLQVALDESEQRRLLLTQKLRDAQDTIELQSTRLKNVEVSMKDNSFAVGDLKHREEELKRKLVALEKDRDGHQKKRLDEARSRTKLLERVEALEGEISNMKIIKTRLTSDADKKKEVIDSVTSTLTILEQENSKLLQAKESFSKEIAAIKESLEIARKRNNWLESHSSETKEEVDKLRKENTKLAEEKRSLNSQLTKATRSTFSFKEESESLSSTVQAMREEKSKGDQEIGRLRAALADLKASFASATSDKERYFQEKLDLHQRIQQLSHDRESLFKTKKSVESQMNELQDQVNEARQGMERTKAERASLDEEFMAVKKVGEVLSVELGNTRTKLERAYEQISNLEQTSKLALQQQELCQQEVRSMEKQINTLKKTLENQRKDYEKERDSHDAGHVKLKEELRHVKSERNHLEQKIHELESRSKQCEIQLKEQGELHRKELETWRSNTEKATTSLARKDQEIQAIQTRKQEMDEEMSALRSSSNNYQSQHEELLESREELFRLRDENRRLLQERGENQQVIQLLEMQKNILSKTCEGSLSKSSDAEQVHAKVDQLMAENNLLEDKIKEIEREKEALQMEKDDRLLNGSDDDCTSPRRGRGSRRQAIIEELEKQVEQITEINVKASEQLTKLEQENKMLKSTHYDMVHKSELQRLESERAELDQNLRRLRMQHEQLEQRHHQVIAEKHIADQEELAAMMKEKDGTEARLALVKSDLVLAENNKLRAEERAASVERQLAQATAKVASSAREREQMAILEVRCNQLQSEIEKSKDIQSKQEAVIQSLKEELEDEKTKKPSKIRQSLDDVGNELTNMRTELQKLMEVIQVKDQAIEDLEQQLKVSKLEVSERERTIEQLSTSTARVDDPSDKTDNDTHATCDDKQNSSNMDTSKLLRQIKGLEEERDELRAQVARLTKERDLALQDAHDLRDGLDDLQQMFDEDRAKLQEKLHREIRAKDRQIECLEEQLRASTSNELRKLKRDAGRVELLRTENRLLQNKISQCVTATKAATANTTYTPASDSMREKPFPPPENATLLAEDILNESWDTDDSLPLNCQRNSLSGNLARELYQAETDGTAPSPEQRLEPNLADNLLTDHDSSTKQIQANNKLDNLRKSTAEIENGHSGELTLADLESDIESSDIRKPPSLPGSSHVTRALRLADLEHNSPSRNGATEYSIDTELPDSSFPTKTPSTTKHKIPMLIHSWKAPSNKIKIKRTETEKDLSIPSTSKESGHRSSIPQVSNHRPPSSRGTSPGQTSPRPSSPRLITLRNPSPSRGPDGRNPCVTRVSCVITCPKPYLRSRPMSTHQVSGPNVSFIPRPVIRANIMPTFPESSPKPPWKY